MSIRELLLQVLQVLQRKALVMMILRRLFAFS